MRPAWPRARITQSFPGSRRRRVSQPSPMLTPRPGAIRFHIDPKCSIVARDGAPAVFQRDQVVLASRSQRRFQGARDLPVDAQARDAAVGEDVEPECVQTLWTVDLNVVVRVAAQIGGSHQRSPCRAAVGLALTFAHIYRCGGRVVASEVAGVDVHAADDAGIGQAHDAPVVALRRACAASPSRPSICRCHRTCRE